jgi:hypothetical protein
VCAPGPLELSTGELRAQPEWYALLMARELIGSQPLPTAVQVRAAHANVHAMGFLAGDGSVRVLVVNDDQIGTPTLTLRLRVAAGVSTGETLMLSAQSLHATEGVELGESEVAPDGTWAPRSVGRAVARGGVIATRLPAASAVLLEVPVPSPTATPG